MAAKKKAKAGGKKSMGKKAMKKTKGGILIGLNQPTFNKLQTDFHKIQPGTNLSTDGFNFLKI